MDSDTLQEKYTRSEEALNRLNDDITELISTRIDELKNSKEYLLTLIREKEAVSAQKTEQEAKIATLRDNVESLKGNLANMKQKQTENIQERKKKEIYRNECSEEHNLLIQTIEKNKTEIMNIKSEIERTKSEREEYQSKIETLKTKLTEDINYKEVEIKALSAEISDIQEENGVLSFLLEESAEDIPEVEILADLMKNGRSTQNQLKKSLEGKISPVMITRTMGRMIENGFVIHHSNDDSYSVK
jgi:chromosome segregation ATPase